MVISSEPGLLAAIISGIDDAKTIQSSMVCCVGPEDPMLSVEVPGDDLLAASEVGYRYQRRFGIRLTETLVFPAGSCRPRACGSGRPAVKRHQSLGLRNLRLRTTRNRPAHTPRCNRKQSSALFGSRRRSVDPLVTTLAVDAVEAAVTVFEPP